MDDFDLAQQLVKSLHDAENNQQEELAASLRVELAEVNARLLGDDIVDFSVSDSWGNMHS